MRWLVVCGEYPPVGGGTANAAYYLLKEWGKMEGLHIDFLTLAPHNNATNFASRNINFHYIHLRKKGSLQDQTSADLIRFTLKARSRIKAMNAVNPYDAAIAIGGIPAGYALMGLKIPYFILLRGSDIPFHNPKFKWIDRLILKHTSPMLWGKARKISVLGAYGQRLVQAIAPGITPHIVPNGIDWTEFVVPPRQQTNVPTLLFAGRIAKVKGAHILAQAILSLPLDLPRVKFIFAGDGPLFNEIKTQLGAVEKHTIEFLGQVPHEALIELYDLVDILVVPSLADNQPNVVLEGMAKGLPMIVTEGGASDLVNDPENALIVPPGDVASLRDALVQIIADGELRRRMTENNLSKIQSYSWEKTAISYFKMVRQGL